MKELYKDIFQSILKKENPLELQRLAAIFEQLSIQAKYKEKEKTFFYEAACLPDFDKEVNPSFFPKKETNRDSSSLLQEIEKEYEKIKNTPDDDYTYFHLVYKYLSRVTDVQDDVVSLFDKYRIAKAKENLKNASQYLLVKGDFSGMQKFIYGGIKTDEGNTQGLSKRLRGRSFYISVMADMVAETFAEELGLGIENVIYSGGGHFLLLCDDTDKNKEKISELTANINDFLLNNVGTALSFITGQASCDGKVFDESGNIGEVMMKLNHDLAGKKYKMYQGNLVGVFGIEEEATFGKRGKDTKEKKHKAYDERLGDLLPRIKTIIELTLSKEWDRNKLVEYVKMQEGEYVACEVLALNKVLIMTKRVDKGYLIKLLGLYSNLVDSVKIIRINTNDNFLKDYQAIKAACPRIKVHFGFRYIGNHTPFSKENKHKIADFEEIIELNNFDKETYFEAIKYTEKDKISFQPWGKAFTENTLYQNYHKQPLAYPKLAVMRLDVDNLGTIFGFGMGEKASLAKTATLSRELHLFFTGYFSVLAKKYDIYVTYSGGDDAFVVGSWIGIAHFAKELYHQFKRFVCANNEITFSAGVFLCDEHYPVAKFAFDAEQQEKRAKSCPTKNAITIFDHTLSFPHYDVMLNFAVNMLKHVRTDDEKADKEKIARSMVHRILRIIKSCINNEDKGFSIKMDKLHRQTANLHYLFARHGFGEKEIDLAKANDERAKAITKDIMEIILCHFKDGDYNCLVPNFLIPTHYVTLLTRKAK